MTLFVLFFPSMWVSWDPQTLQNKGKRKVTNRPSFTLPPVYLFGKVHFQGGPGSVRFGYGLEMERFKAVPVFGSGGSSAKRVFLYLSTV